MKEQVKTLKQLFNSFTKPTELSKKLLELSTNSVYFHKNYIGLTSIVFACLIFAISLISNSISKSLENVLIYAVISSMGIFLINLFCQRYIVIKHKYEYFPLSNIVIFNAHIYTSLYMLSKACGDGLISQLLAITSYIFILFIYKGINLYFLSKNDNKERDQRGSTTLIFTIIFISITLVTINILNSALGISTLNI